jgi:hypothetical protein
MRIEDERRLADELLVEWHDWTAAYRPALGMDRVSASCREARSNRQYEDSTEASCGRLHANEMQAVAFCVQQLPIPQQIAIGIEMKNRHSRAKVWRSEGADTFANALGAICPLMRRRGLFDGKQLTR